MWYSRLMFLGACPWSWGAPGFWAACGSNTAVNSSYSTFIKSRASRATSASTAATAATSSPMKRTRSTANGYSSIYLGDLEMIPNFICGVSAAVTIALTPGNFRALDVSMPTIPACGRGLRRIAPHNIRGKDRSSVYRALPVTLSLASTRGSRFPMTLYFFISYPFSCSCRLTKFQNGYYSFLSNNWVSDN